VSTLYQPPLKCSTPYQLSAFICAYPLPTSPSCVPTPYQLPSCVRPLFTNPPLLCSTRLTNSSLLRAYPYQLSTLVCAHYLLPLCVTSLMCDRPLPKLILYQFSPLPVLTPYQLPPPLYAFTPTQHTKTPPSTLHNNSPVILSFHDNLHLGGLGAHGRWEKPVSFLLTL